MLANMIILWLTLTICTRLQLKQLQTTYANRRGFEESGHGLKFLEPPLRNPGSAPGIVSSNPL